MIYLSRIVLLAIKKGNDALNPDKGKSRPSFQTTSGNVLKLDTTLLKAMRFDRCVNVCGHCVRKRVWSLCVCVCVYVFFRDVIL